ncbi:major facilitator superfamily domain-containing protein [Coemansia spiralis]|nr:major facilitator superfamily domain-containing protein [Coemansia spiralis]
MAAEANDHDPLLRAQEPAPINQRIQLTVKESQVLASYVRKCDRRLLFYLCVGYALDSLNKMSLAYAKISGLTTDLPININLALGSYYVGCFLFQLPSNLVMKKVRPRIWLSTLMFLWSVVTILTGLARSSGELILLRFVFGAVQAGYLTGSIYYISCWYPRGWRVIFVAIGSLSLLWSLLGPLVLEDYPHSAGFITEEERQLISKIIENQNIRASSRVSSKQVAMAVRDCKVWLWTVIGFCANGATQVNGMFGPTIIASRGYSVHQAQLLTALTNLMSLLGMLSIAHIAKKLTKSSARAIILSNAITISGFLVALYLPKYAMAALFLFSFASPQPAAHGPAWEMANLQGGTKPAMAAAITMAFGGLGPLVTAFVYRDRDQPRFVLGHSACLLMTLVCLGATAVVYVLMDRENKRRDQEPGDISRLSPDQVLDLADNHPDFRYKL